MKEKSSAATAHLHSIWSAITRLIVNVMQVQHCLSRSYLFMVSFALRIFADRSIECARRRCTTSFRIEATFIKSDNELFDFIRVLTEVPYTASSTWKPFYICHHGVIDFCFCKKTLFATMRTPFVSRRNSIESSIRSLLKKLFYIAMQITYVQWSWRLQKKISNL